MSATVYTCALCGRKVRTQEGYLLHLLRERGTDGVTTGQAVQWNVGTRAIGGRIHDLRNAGHKIKGVKLVGSSQWVYTLTADAEGGSRGTVSSSSRAAPVAPLNAGKAYVCWATQECRAAGPLDGQVCPRGDWHTVRRVHYLDLVPRAVEERIAA